MSRDVFNVVLPNQRLGAGDLNALMTPEYQGIVENVIKRKSVIAPHVTFKTVRGTNTLTQRSVTAGGLVEVQRGVTPDGAPGTFSKISVDVDRMLLSRNVIALLDTFQTEFDVRAELATAAGEYIARWMDSAILIQVALGAALADSPYGATSGFTGGSTSYIPAGQDTDPAALERAVADLVQQMAEKDVETAGTDFLLVLAPAQFYSLFQSEHVINSNYVTANGTRIEDGFRYKSFGVPVVQSNNLPKGVITTHLLGPEYTGDFTNLRGVLFNVKRGLLAGSSIPLTSKIHYDDISLSWYVDSYFAMGVTPNRAEFLGRIMLE